MNLIWGAILCVISSMAYFGQLISAIRPATAVKWGLSESETEVDRTFYADLRGEAMWDALVLWTLPLAGVLLMLDSPLWAYFGLIGGGMYLYFAGRGIVVRNVMQQRDIRIGTPTTVRVARIFLALWGIVAAATIVMAIATLRLP